MTTAAATAPVETGPVTGSSPCNHCTTHSTDGIHTHCPGAIENGARGRLWVCPCGCKPLACIKCHSTEGVSPETWKCTDADACEAAVARRIASNPTLQVIREITARARERVAQEKGIARTAEPASAVFRPGAGKCECGCGASTGSRFAMGHDARLRSQLAKAYRGVPEHSLPGDRNAGLELAARGGIWAKQAPDVEAPADPDAFVAARVAERLS